MNESKIASTDAGSTQVYFDGECPLCQAVVETVKNEADKAPIFLDVHRADLPGSVSKDEALRAMHVVKDGAVEKSAAALFSLLELVPRYLTLAKIAKWPIILPIMELGYKLISPQRHWLYGERGRVTALAILTVLGLFVSILLSAPLWFTNRPFPSVPIINAPIWSQVLLLIILIAAPLVALIFKRLRLGFALLALSIVGLVLFDQMRLQPWVLHYTAIIFLLAAFSWQRQAEDKTKLILNNLRLIVVAIYFWSGVQKLNPYFFGEVFPWLMKDITAILSPDWSVVLLALGLFIPFIEIAIALCLLLPTTRRLGMLFASGMLIFVLATIGPLGAAVNSVVWPWNVVLWLSALVLFINTKDLGWKAILIPKGYAKKIIWLVFVILPAFSFFSPYDSYLSWSLYSGTVNQATFIVDAAALATLPAVAQSAALPAGEAWRLTLVNWSFAALNVPPYPEERVFKTVFAEVCKIVPEGSEVVMETTGRRFYTAGLEPKQYYCKD